MSYEPCPTCGAMCRVQNRHNWRAGLLGNTQQWIAGILWGLAVPIAYLVYYYVHPNAMDIDFSRGLYRIIGQHVIPYTEAPSFSISLVLTVALIVGGPLLWIFRMALLVWRGEGILAALVWGPARLFLIAPLLFVWFVVFWGAGYQRPPVEKRLDFATTKPTEEEILKIQDGLLAVILRDQPKSDADRDVDRAVASISDAMAKFIEETEGKPERVPHRVKATPPGVLLFNSTSGICSPYTLEANDMRFATNQGFNTGEQFETYLKDTFDTLYAEGATRPRMMSIGLHCRIVGRPGRFAALKRFVDYARRHDKVWFAQIGRAHV